MRPHSYYIGFQRSQGAAGKMKQITLTIPQKLEIIMRLESGLMPLSRHLKEISKNDNPLISCAAQM
jgi:hypothetical protein